MKKEKSKQETKQRKPRGTIWLILELVGLLLIVISPFIYIHEISAPRQFCEEQGMKFKLRFGTTSCNGQEIFKYKDGWDFNREIPQNFTIQLP